MRKETVKEDGVQEAAVHGWEQAGIKAKEQSFKIYNQYLTLKQNSLLKIKITGKP